MPNWCSTSYHAVGDKKQLQRLYDAMAELEAMPSPGLLPNGFGSTWMGNLIHKLGGDWKKIYCRASWNGLDLMGDTLYFDTESAWCEPDEVRHFIEAQFPDMKLYFQSEEPGQGIYTTNDDTGEHFPDQYYLWIEDDDTTYHETAESLCREVEQVTGSKHLSTVEACQKALKSYSKRHHNLGYSLEEFTLVE